MTVTLLLARLTLALVLLVAGVAKIGNAAKTRQTLLDFGMPPRMTGAFAWMLPVAELGIGAAMIPEGTMRWGAAGALALLVVFLVAISWNLRRGRRPDCRCFGQLRSSPIGWKLVARNVTLIGLAGMVLWLPEPASGIARPDWFILPSAELVAMLALVLAVSACALAAAGLWLLSNLVRQHGRLLHRLDALEIPRVGAAPGQPVLGMPVGLPAPGFSLPSLAGRPVSLDQLRSRGKPVLLLFMDPHCGPCRALVPEIAAWTREHSERLTVTVVTRGRAEELLRTSGALAADTLIQEGEELGDRYQTHATPSALVIDRRGRVASPVAQGAVAIRQLVERFTAPPRLGSRSSIGTAARVAPGAALLAATAVVATGSKPPTAQGISVIPAAALQVHDGSRWRTWWRSDSAPEVWTAPESTVLAATTWRTLAAGVDVGEVVVSGGGLGLRTRVVLGRFDPRRYRIAVAAASDESTPRAKWTIDSASRRAVLAFNGGQFIADRPWGWLVTRGREVQAPGWGPLSMAVALMRSGEYRFVSAESLQMVRHAGETMEALQSFPALLTGDGVVPGPLRGPRSPVDLEHRDSRLAICLLHDGRLLVALTRFDSLGRIFGAVPIGLTLPELVAVMGALGCRRAVGLDGGLSAQLLARTEGELPLRWVGSRPVPVGLEVVGTP